MQNRRNYYQILHVQPDAPAEIIQTSYRTLMQRLKMHPDLGGDQGQAALINEAYASLSDPERRAKYDRQMSNTTEHLQGGCGPSSQRGTTIRTQKQPNYKPGHGCAFCGTPHSPGAESRSGATCTECFSPLFPAIRQQLENESRRAVKRFPRSMVVNFYSNWPQNHSYLGATEDISLNGMRFTTATELIQGDRIKIDCEVCGAIAIVRDCRYVFVIRGRNWQVGVEFLTFKPKQAKGNFFAIKV